MSRLDAIANRFGGNKRRAKEFTRAVRAQFDAAPSYAQIMRALEQVPGRNPDPNRVVKLIKRDLETDGRRGKRPYKDRSKAARKKAQEEASTGHLPSRQKPRSRSKPRSR